MKKTFLITLIFCSVSLFAQRVEFIANFSRNSFYDFKQEDPHQSFSYESGNGYGLKLCMDKFGGQFHFLRLSLGYETYQGTASATEGGLGGSSSTEIDVKKSVFSLGVYPLNLSIKKLFHISLGGEYARLLNEKYTGTYRSWQMGNILGTSESFDETVPRHANYNAQDYLGLAGRFAFTLHLSEQWTLLPQYSFYWGLKKEFKRTPSSDTKSFRNYLGVGIAYQWHKHKAQ